MFRSVPLAAGTFKFELNISANRWFANTVGLVSRRANRDPPPIHPLTRVFRCCNGLKNSWSRLAQSLQWLVRQFLRMPVRCPHRRRPGSQHRCARNKPSCARNNPSGRAVRAAGCVGIDRSLHSTRVASGPPFEDRQSSGGMFWRYSPGRGFARPRFSSLPVRSSWPCGDPRRY